MWISIGSGTASGAVRMVVAGLVSASLLTVFAAQSASAAPPPTTQPTITQTRDGLSTLGIATTSDGWYSYTKSTSSTLGLGNPKTTTITGTRDTDGSCVISGTDPGSGLVPTYTEEVAFNPTTCQSKVLTGTITATAASRLAATDVADTEASATSTGTGTASTGTLTTQGAERATSYASAHTVTSWIDPFNITITRQKINLKWPLHGAGGTLTSTYPAYKFKYDGWSVYGPNFSGFKKLSGDAGWYVSANSHFVNYDFAALVYALLGLSGWLACGAHLSTRADFYHNVKVTGRRSGSRSHDWSDKKSGACSNLVHHKTSTGSGWA